MHLFAEPVQTEGLTRSNRSETAHSCLKEKISFIRKTVGELESLLDLLSSAAAMWTAILKKHSKIISKQTIAARRGDLYAALLSPHPIVQVPLVSFPDHFVHNINPKKLDKVRTDHTGLYCNAVA